MIHSSLRHLAAVVSLFLTLSLVPAATALAQAGSPAPAASHAPASSSLPDAPSGTPCVEPEASAAPLPDQALTMPESFRVELFDGVWQGIRDYYIDPGTNGLDWDAIGDEYAPLILETENAYRVYDLLNEMVALLDDPYTGFYAPEDLRDAVSADPSYGGIGALLDTSAAGAQTKGLRIMYVFQGGSADDAGIAARDRIVAVDGDPCARIADIRGPEGSEVTLTVVSPGQGPRDITLERRRISPVILPESHRLEADPSIGYLRLVSLAGQETIDAVEQALTVFQRGAEPITGLVIDVRGTNQGAPGVIIEILRTFVSGDVGEFHSRVGNEPIAVEPNDLAEAYADVPLAVLVDENSEAEAEQLAAILQDQGRATVVGEQTAGQTHGTQTIDLPDGSLLQIVSFGFQLPDGTTLEGQGVAPDVPVGGDWLDFPASEDPGVLAAVDVIDAERAAASTAASEAPVPEASPAG